MRVVPKLLLALFVLALTVEVGSRLVLAVKIDRDVLGAVLPNVLTATGTPVVGYLPDLPFVTPPPGVTLAAQPASHGPDSPLFHAAPEDLVIAVCGGSVAFHYVMDGSATVLGERIAAMPAYAGRRPRIVALAAVGMKQPQHAMWLSYVLALGARIDVVITLDGFNEVAMHEHENEPYGVSTVYPRLWLQRVSPAEAAPLIGRRIDLTARRGQLARRFAASPWRHSGVGQLLWLLDDQAARRGVEAAEETLQQYRQHIDLDFITSGPVLPGSTEDQRLEASVALWRSSALLMHRLAAAHGARSFHFLQPNQYVPGSKPLSAWEQENALVEGHHYGRMVPAGYSRLQAAGATLVADGARFHDLTQVFAGVEEALYVDDCCHLNVAGNRRLADAMAGAIAAWGQD
jgi:hypothetical protein